MRSDTSDSMLNYTLRENVNRMLIKEVFVEVAALTGKPFDLEACRDDDDVNSHCVSCCSPSSSFLKRDVSGQHVWLNVPTNRIELFIKHYLKCKARALPVNFCLCCCSMLAGTLEKASHWDEVAQVL